MAEIKAYFDLDGIEKSKLDAIIPKVKEYKQLINRYTELEDKAGQLNEDQVDFNGLLLDTQTLLNILEKYDLSDEDLVMVHEIAYPVILSTDRIINSKIFKQALKETSQNK